MTKTLLTDDWTKIENSFDIMNKRFSNAFNPKDTPVYKFISIEGIKEQIEERSVGEFIFYMDYSISNESPKLGKSVIINDD